jgi:hypothetical protein
MKFMMMPNRPRRKYCMSARIAINPCQDAKVLADWYSRFGIETKEFKGGYYAQLNTAAGPFFFAVHPKKADAPAKCSASVAVVFRVEDFERSLLALKSKGLLPDSTEKDPTEGQFAHFPRSRWQRSFYLGGNMNLVDGIGGAFLFSNDTKRLAAWYRDCLGIAPQGEDAECSSIYASFDYRDLENPEIKRTIAWAIVPTKEDIKDKPRTGKINYTVKNMGEVLSHLKSKGVAIEKTRGISLHGEVCVA